MTTRSAKPASASSEPMQACMDGTHLSASARSDPGHGSPRFWHDRRLSPRSTYWVVL
jgi:hypothetical protein